jgi:hypothetical protein
LPLRVVHLRGNRVTRGKPVDVADEPTNRLLPDFYRTWLAQSKGAALREARLLRDSGWLRHDHHARRRGVTPRASCVLAGFALFGEPD